MYILCIDKLYYSMSISCLYIYIRMILSNYLENYLIFWIDTGYPPSSRDTAPIAGVNIKCLGFFQMGLQHFEVLPPVFFPVGTKSGIVWKRCLELIWKRCYNKLYKSTSLKTSWQHKVKNSTSEVKQCWCSFCCWSEISNEFSWKCMKMCSKTSLTFAVHR